MMLGLTYSKVADAKADKTLDLFDFMHSKIALTRMEVLASGCVSDGYLKSLIKISGNALILTEKSTDDMELQLGRLNNLI